MKYKNPWSVCDAFEPMFTETIGLFGVRKNNHTIRTSFKASVFPVIDSEPFSDISVDSECQKIRLVADLSLFTKLQIGDELTLEDSRRFLICKVEKNLEFVSIEARSK